MPHTRTTSAPSAPVSPDSRCDPLRRAPRALLLDFGGVIVTPVKRQRGREEFALALSRRLASAGAQVPADRLLRCLEGGSVALKHWKHASSRRLAPRELTVQEILGDFFFSDLEDPVRALLVGDGAGLLDEMATAWTDHPLRAGVRALLDRVQGAGISLGIVSNAHSGRSHRRILSGYGLSGAFGVQIYSDEAGIRKPHPDMLHRAADALGVPTQDCWYVGDTRDRDLVAGRRADAGAVVLTRSQHTDAPPFGVSGEPDAVVDSPVRLLELLEEALAADGGPSAGSVRTGPVPAVSEASAAGRRDRALLLDHGGVVSTTVKPETPFLEAAKAVEASLARAGCPVSEGEGMHIVKTAHAEYRRSKGGEDAALPLGGPQEAHSRWKDLGEVTPEQYWGEFTAAAVTDRRRKVLLAEAHELQLALYRSKSQKTERPGIREMLRHCAQTGRPVIIVSNTISGRGVRAVLRSYGLEHLIAGWVCSDELGVKKPHPCLFEWALRMAGVPPEHAVMVGDKPWNDAFGAWRSGIGRRIITRGGSGTEEELATGLAEGWITDVVDHPGQIPELLR